MLPSGTLVLRVVWVLSKASHPVTGTLDPREVFIAWQSGVTHQADGGAGAAATGACI